MSRSTNSLKIPRAEPKDAEIIAPLFDAYRQFYRQAEDLAGACHFISDRLKANQWVVFVALIECEAKSTAAGFVQLYPAFSSVSMRPLWILNDI